MESNSFIEAIRQIRHEVGYENCMYIHVTLVPYISGSYELKTKPTQHSVKELLSMGIQPDVIVCRTDLPLNDDIKEKLSLFCNVPADCVIENSTVSVLYEAPVMLEKNGLGKEIGRAHV